MQGGDYRLHEKPEEAMEWIDAKTASKRFNVSVPRLHDLAYMENSPLEGKYEKFGKIRERFLFSVASLRRWNSTRIDRWRQEERETDRPGRLEPLGASL